MSIPPVGAVDTAATAASNTKGAASAAGSLSFDEVFKLAMLPGETGDISAHAKSLIQQKGIASAIALLGN